MPDDWTDLKDPTWTYWYVDDPHERNPVDDLEDVVIEALDESPELWPLFRATDLRTRIDYTRDQLFEAFPDLVKKWSKR